MTVSITGPQPPQGAQLTAWHNADGTITVSLPQPQIILDRESADRLAAYLQKETN